jgi:hypothetical protein
MNILIAVLVFTKLYVLFAYFKVHQSKRVLDLIIDLSFFAFHCFSWAQMKVIQITTSTREYVKRKPKLKKLLGALLTKTNGYKLIRNNKEVAFLKDTGNNVIIIDEQYDFMIYVNYEDDMIKNVLCRRNDWSCPRHVLDMSKKQDPTTTCSKADFKFILVEVILNDDVCLSVNLTGDQYNYMITGNLLNKMFFVYFLKTHYAESLRNITEDEINNYKIKILDHNMDSVEFTSQDVLCIEKDSYKIIKL